MENPNTPDGAPPPPDDTIDDAQLSPRAWLARNGPVVILALAAVVFLYYKFGLEGMWTIAKVAIGLSAVIFIHELGHFAVAKWCDVHVQTFSIGFGPALPGCSYKWGETTYKLALFPLGGYVKMVGEGGENDEEDTDPRSYKNKTVGQRMAIISAGVIMNVLFGVVAFIIAFKVGVHQHAPVVGVVEAGGQAWRQGVRTGDVLLQIDDNKHPYMEDLKGTVMLSSRGERIPFVFSTPVPGVDPDQWPKRSLDIEPRKGKNEPNPVIGVSWPMELRLPDQREAPIGFEPVVLNSPAAAARALDLKPDDEVLAATEPGQAAGEAPAQLPKPNDFAALAERLAGLADQPMRISFRRNGEVKMLTVPPGGGFELGDAIVGTSDPNKTNPFETAKLDFDPRDPGDPRHPGKRHLDYFQLLDRLRLLEGRPMVIQLHRKGAAPEEVVNLLLPPAFHRIIPGVRMEMGPVLAVRDGSDAAAQGMKEHDTITAVTLTDGQGSSLKLALNPTNPEEKQLDPLRLPHDLRTWATGRENVTAGLMVRRQVQHDKDASAEVTGLKWDHSWDDDDELPIGVNAALAIPQLGIAYQVAARVAHVEPDCEAANKGLRDGDFILGWGYQVPAKTPGQPPKWEKTVEFGSKNNPTGTPDLAWAGVDSVMQSLPYSRVKLVHRHDDGTEEETELELQADTNWPLDDPAYLRGLRLPMIQDRIAIAGSLGEAVQMGVRHTSRTIVQIYMGLKSLVAGRVSVTQNLQGPIDIAVFAYATAGSDWADFILLLGLISVNLAVVNFLPIPLLDGGHMVFLIYEKLRGKPASEHVRYASSLLGIVVLLSLMIFVLGLGFYRWIWPLINPSG